MSQSNKEKRSGLLFSFLEQISVIDYFSKLHHFALKTPFLRQFFKTSHQLNVEYIKKDVPQKISEKDVCPAQVTTTEQEEKTSIEKVDEQKRKPFMYSDALEMARSIFGIDINTTKEPTPKINPSKEDNPIEVMFVKRLPSNNDEKVKMDKETALRIVKEIGEYKNPTYEQCMEAWQYLHDSRWAYALGGWFELTVKELLRTKTIKDNGVKGY